jgi:predicted NBD/HSP70 family sugar kinase
VSASERLRDTRTATREASRARVVDALRSEGASSRAQLVAVTGLSRATVSAVVAALQCEGLVLEEPAATDRRVPGRGRPPSVLRFNTAARAVLGLAVERDGVRAAVADLALHVLGEGSTRVDVANAPVDEMLGAAEEAIDGAVRASALPDDRLIGVGVSLPVPIDLVADRVAAPKIIVPWARLRPRREFEELTGLPVQIDNDANTAALAELRWGAARGLSDFVYVKLSPGVGGAIVSGGRLYRGALGFAGEVGHVRVGEHGPVCACGNRGCIGPSVTLRSLVELLRPVHGRRLTPRGVLKLLAEGDAATARVVGDAGRTLGRAVADLCNVLNPQAIVIGGALAAAGEALVGGVREAVDAYALRPIADTVEVRLAELGERGELLGALALVPVDEPHAVRA